MPPTSSESIRSTGGIPMSTRTDWTPTYGMVFNPIPLGKTAISEATISRRPSFGLGGFGGDQLRSQRPSGTRRVGAESGCTGGLVNAYADGNFGGPGRTAPDP